MKKAFPFLIFFGFVIFQLSAQNNPKIGIALSGGGAKGFAHIGVLKVLEKEGIPVDAISGVSMGSIVGALYSIGYNSDELEKIALNTNWTDLFLDEIKRNNLSFSEKQFESKYLLSLPFDSLSIGLPKGLIQGYKVNKLLARYTRSVHHLDSFKDFPIPFTCVATNLKSGEPHEFSNGYLPFALRASMAIPSVFTPQLINDSLYIDGFVSRNLPAENVKDLGADIIIGSDVGENVTENDNINSLVDVLNQTMSYKGAKEDEKQRMLCDILIRPDMTGLNASSFDKVKILIKRGEEAASKALPKIRKILDSLNIKKGKNNLNLVLSDSIKISKVIIQNSDKFVQDYVSSEFTLQEDSTYSITDIEKAVDEIYALRFFDKISYRIVPTPEGSQFYFNLSKRDKDEFRFGMNYNTVDKASLIFNINLMNFFASLNRYTIDLRLGERSSLELNYFGNFSDYKKGGLNLKIGITDYETDVYEDELKVNSFRTINFYSSAYLGTIFSSTVNTGIGIGFDYVNVDMTSTPIEFPAQEDSYISLFTKFELDNTESRYFPKHGNYLNLFGKAYYSIDPSTRMDLPLIKYGIVYQNYSELVKKISFIFDSRLLLSTRKTLPNFDYRLDIREGFYGASFDEMNNSNAFMAKIGNQFELTENNFVLLEFNVGGSASNWDSLWQTKDLVTGLGLTYAYNSILGPLRVTAMTGNLHRFLFFASVGFDF